MTSGPFTWPWKEKEKNEENCWKIASCNGGWLQTSSLSTSGVVKCGNSSGRSFRCPHVGTNRPTNRAPHSAWGHRDYSSLRVTKSLLFLFYFFLFFFNRSKRFNSIRWLDVRPSRHQRYWGGILVCWSDFFSSRWLRSCDEAHDAPHMITLIIWNLQKTDNNQIPLVS